VISVTGGIVTATGAGLLASELVVTSDNFYLCTTLPTVTLALDTTAVSVGNSAAATAIAGTAGGDFLLSHDAAVANTACKDCLAGYFSSSDGGLLACTVCPGGYYQTAAVQTVCIACAGGTYDDTSLTGQAVSICKDCPAGYFSASGVEAKKCTVCPTSYYQAATVQTACSGCASGQYDTSATTGNIANTNCIVCPIAYKSYPSGQAACTACPAGYYGASTSQSSCIQCPSAKYVEQEAQTLCNAASTCGNLYRVSVDNTKCEMCARKHIIHWPSHAATATTRACYDCTSHHDQCEKANCEYSGVYCNEYE